MNRILILFLLVLLSCNNEKSSYKNNSRNQRAVTEDSLTIKHKLDSLMRYKHNVSRYLGFLNYYLSNHNKELNLNLTYYKENARFVQEMNFEEGIHSSVVDTSKIDIKQINDEVKVLDSLLKVNKTLIDSNIVELTRVTSKEK